ncbi:V-type ATP synthase subunit A [Rhodovulum sp. P5]|uniref:V-type ATP synthase subunit A n=1 Tax=Rhodovulum sp. P5 TaxID=1564506 RepID=UPI0009C32198|nr:V-type ATP synthase subunit A [Rhodovulum sp. P5]ARE40988.1 V-type ATP synthase subunit A [Rhodovulum sp. P5]
MAEAAISWAGGPIVHGRPDGAFAVGEAITVAGTSLLGEVIRVSHDRIIAQIYGDTTGLRPGLRLAGTGRALSVTMGPHLLGGIFDGLLRPLTGAAADDRSMTFRPGLAPGDAVVSGQPFGTAIADGSERPIPVPPGISGTLHEIAPPGHYGMTERLGQVRAADGSLHDLSMLETWPIRQPRPIRRRLSPNRPMVTGQRILDSLFPVARGGKAAIPGGFGTGKTVLQETLAKWCDADIIIYVGCGERGNEMAEVLHEFPDLTDPRTGRPLMERTVMIANTSNMPVAAREASIYTAVTVGEYFRDQGLHVALMADSTSRWAEALREVSGRLGELPAEAGYPAYLSSRLAEFYERAARVETLSGAEGSLTLIGAVSPPAGDFSEPVTSHTKRYVRSFWGLDRERAQARFYPAIHPLQSYSEDAEAFAAWWATKGNDQWDAQRRRMLTLLEEEARLERMTRIVGKDALPPAQQMVLTAAELVNEAILRQSAFSENDRYCSPARQTRMLRLVMRAIDLGNKALQSGVAPQDIAALAVLRRIKRMGEDISDSDPDAFDRLGREMEQAFSDLTAEVADAG